MVSLDEPADWSPFETNMGDQEVSICAACPADNQDEVTQVCKRWKITKAFSQAIDAGASFSAKHWLSQVALAVAWLVEERCATRANIVCIEGGRWCGLQMGQQEVLCQAVRAELKSADFPIRVKWMPIQDFLDGAGDVGKSPVSRDYLAQMAAELYGDDSNTEPVASAGCEFYNICDPDAKERKGESRSSTSPRAFKTAPRVSSPRHTRQATSPRGAGPASPRGGGYWRPASQLSPRGDADAGKKDTKMGNWRGKVSPRQAATSPRWVPKTETKSDDSQHSAEIAGAYT